MYLRTQVTLLLGCWLLGPSVVLIAKIFEGFKKTAKYVEMVLCVLSSLREKIGSSTFVHTYGLILFLSSLYPSFLVFEYLYNLHICM